ncbi:MAG: ATPase [Thermoplasmata archaeon]|nr:MAG: ATPase [Thermoplasmata archaeon]
MPKIVVKKDGREEFIPEKIVVAAVKSGAKPEVARKIAKDIEKIDKEKIESSEIREEVLKNLRNESPALEKKWLAYDKSVKRLYRHYKDGLYG